MVRSRSKMLVALGALVWTFPLGAQALTGAVTGPVIDSTSQQPVARANVVLEGTPRGTVTRSDGSFTLAGVPAGTQGVRVNRIGYTAQAREVAVTAGGTVTVQFALAPAATQLHLEA